MAALRRLLVPVLELSRQRHNRVKLRSHVALPDVTPKQLVSTLGYNTTYIGKWPPELLEDMCKDCIRGFAFPGEIIAHENEPVSTHGLIIVVRGMVGVMRAGGPAVTAALVAEVMSLDPSAREGKQHAVPTRSVRAPTVLGEMQCLTDGINSGGAVRALSITDYVTINIARIREAITKHLPPAQLNATFNKEVRLARKAALRQFFHQTPPLMLLSWVCHEMTPDEVNRLIAQLTPEVAVPGQDIVVQGAAASSMYFLRRGTACIVVGGNVIPGVVLGPGKSFGEMGLLFHERRMATVRATSLCDLWVLSERALHSVFSREMVEKKILGKATEIRTRMISSVSRATLKPALLSYPPFAELPEAGVAELLAALQPRVYPSGRVMQSAGHVSDAMILMHSGQASTVDSAVERFEKGAALGVHSVVRHRQLTTVAAIGVVDAFLLEARDARRVLRKHGLLERAVEFSEDAIGFEARQRGIEHRDVFDPKPSRPSDECSRGTPASPRPPKGDRTTAAVRPGARAHRFDQPFVDFQRPPYAVTAARERAEALLAGFRVASTGPEAFDVPRELEKFVVTETSQEVAKQLWQDRDFQLMTKDQAFAATFAHLPSSQHAVFSVLTSHWLRESQSASTGNASEPPVSSGTDDRDAVTRESASTSRTSVVGVEEPADDVKALSTPPGERIFASLNLSSAAALSGDAGYKRPMYQPINPHSYAAVLPLSMQPLTRREGARTFGRRPLSACWLDSNQLAAAAEGSSRAAATAPPLDLAQLAFDMMGVLTVEERQDITTYGDGVLNDADHFDDAWKEAMRYVAPRAPPAARAPKAPPAARGRDLSTFIARPQPDTLVAASTVKPSSDSTVTVLKRCSTNAPPPSQVLASTAPVTVSVRRDASEQRDVRPKTARHGGLLRVPLLKPSPTALRVRYVVRPMSARLDPIAASSPRLELLDTTNRAV